MIVELYPYATFPSPLPPRSTPHLLPVFRLEREKPDSAKKDKKKGSKKGSTPPEQEKKNTKLKKRGETDEEFIFIG